LHISPALTFVFYRFREPLYTDPNGTDVRIWDEVFPTDEEIQVLEFNKDIRMIPDPFVRRRKFWENIGLPDTFPVTPFNQTTLS